MDGATPHDRPLESGLLDQSAELVPSDLPDVSVREDVDAPEDTPGRETAIDDGPAVDGAAQDAPVDRASPTCDLGQFEASPRRHALPGGYVASAFEAAEQSSSCSGTFAGPGYALFDMNGDQRPDLVVTRACEDDAVGFDHWRVYLNTGTAFAETATRFALPGGYDARTFTGTDRLSSCSGASGGPGFRLHDVNGDRRPDLVFTHVCADDAVGSDHWRVYLNTGSAFAGTAARFALPVGYTANAFRRSDQSSSCSGASRIPGCALYDVNGDQRPDLIVTRACEDDAVGSDHWRVYLNTGSAFAATATRFALPGGYVASTFSTAVRSSLCSVAPGLPGFALHDVNGDQRPDLVFTRVCEENAVGSDHWRVYLNTGSAFTGTVTRFALPGGYAASAFATLAGFGSCSGAVGGPGYELHDVNADQRPDLVVTRACEDDAVGSDHWRVYLNTGSTFAATVARFPLPGGYVARAFTTASRSRACAGASGSHSFALRDMNGDQRPDLVVTSACGDGAVGSLHWRVHLNACM